jgi:hypothetical protein
MRGASQVLHRVGSAQRPSVEGKVVKEREDDASQLNRLISTWRAWRSAQHRFWLSANG